MLQILRRAEGRGFGIFRWGRTSQVEISKLSHPDSGEACSRRSSSRSEGSENEMLSPPKAGITGTRAIMHFGAGGAALPCARLTGRQYRSPGMDDRWIWEAGRRAKGRRGLDVGGFSLQSQNGLQPTRQDFPFLSWGSRLTSLLRRPVTRALPFMARCHFSSFENVPGRKQG